MSQQELMSSFRPVWICALACIVGCGESKRSLHEMDHVIPTHWPTGCADAAGKLRERVSLLQSATESNSTVDYAATFKELCDLVDWVPEVAADTDLAEADWIKLYEASERARKRLLSSTSINTGLVHDIETLCTLLIESQSQIPALVESVDSSLLEPNSAEEAVVASTEAPPTE